MESDNNDIAKYRMYRADTNTETNAQLYSADKDTKINAQTLQTHAQMYAHMAQGRLGMLTSSTGGSRSSSSSGSSGCRGATWFPQMQSRQHFAAHQAISFCHLQSEGAYDIAFMVLLFDKAGFSQFHVLWEQRVPSSLVMEI